MPVLPLNHPEPFAATLGVMLYPGLDEADQRRAAAFAAQYLAEPLRQFHQQGGKLTYESLAFIVESGGERLDDLEKRWWAATATGELFKAYFALATTHPELASWNNANAIAETVAGKAKVSGTRSSLMAARSQFNTVAHLWGALSH